jgi:hypothetical protein
LNAHSVADCVSIVERWSNIETTQRTVRELLAGHKAGLLVIDANGEAERDFSLYRDLLAPGAALVIDDYFAPDNIKSANVYALVSRMVEQGTFQQTAVVPYGTWFGRLRS